MHRKSANLILILVSLLSTPSYAVDCSSELIKKSLRELWQIESIEYKVMKQLFDELLERFPPGASEKPGLPSKKAMSELSTKILEKLNKFKAEGQISPEDESSLTDAMVLLNFFSTEGLTVTSLPKRRIKELIEISRVVQGGYRTPLSYSFEGDYLVIKDGVTTEWVLLSAVDEIEEISGKKLGEIPDLKQVLTLPQYEKMDSKFKEALASEVPRLTLKQQEVFIRVVLKGERAIDIAKDLDSESVHFLYTRKANTIDALRRHFKTKHPNLLDQFNDFVKEKSDQQLGRLPFIGSAVEVSEVRQVLASPEFANLDPKFKETLAELIPYLAPNYQQGFVRLVLKGEKATDVVNRNAGEKINNIYNRRTNSLLALRRLFEKKHPEQIENFDDFIKSNPYLPKIEPKIPKDAQLVEIKAALESVDPKLLKPELKEVLTIELNELFPLNRNMFLRTIVNLEKDADVASSLNYKVSTIKTTSLTAAKQLKDLMKLKHPELVDEFEAFLVHQKKIIGKRGYTPTQGWIPDVHRILASPRFEQLDSHFKEILAQEISALSPLSQQAFIRLVLLGEKTSDIAIVTGAKNNGQVAHRRMNSINQLERRFKEKHPELVKSFQEFMAGIKP